MKIVFYPCADADTKYEILLWSKNALMSTTHSHLQTKHNDTKKDGIVAQRKTESGKNNFDMLFILCDMWTVFWVTAVCKRERVSTQRDTIRHFVALVFIATMKKSAYTHRVSERVSEKKECYYILFFTSIECARILWFVDSFFAWRNYIQACIEAGRQKENNKSKSYTKKSVYVQRMYWSNGMKCAHSSNESVGFFSVFCCCCCCDVCVSLRMHVSTDEYHRIPVNGSWMRMREDNTHTNTKKLLALGQQQQQKNSSSRNCVRASSKSLLNALCV